jgi:hypothetical protein
MNKIGIRMKKAPLLTILATILFVLTACGSGSASTNSAGSGTASTNSFRSGAASTGPGGGGFGGGFSAGGAAGGASTTTQATALTAAQAAQARQNAISGLLINQVIRLLQTKISS